MQRTTLVTGLVAATALAGPAAAYDRMTRNDCIRAFANLAVFIDGEDGNPQALDMGNDQVVTGDGWCRIRGRNGGHETAEFDSIDWRAEGIDNWIDGGVPPQALELRVTGLEPDKMQGGGISTDRPPLTLELALRQIPQAGQLIVERIEMDNGRGDQIAGSMVLERVYLSTPSMVQVSLGSVTFRAGLFQMALTGEVENPFAFDIDVDLRADPEAQRRSAFDLISKLPDGVVSDATRAELTEFAGALPKPEGELELSVASERGFGLMQMVMAAVTGTADLTTTSGMEVLLDGITITADWSPAGGQTD